LLARLHAGAAFGVEVPIEEHRCSERQGRVRTLVLGDGAHRGAELPILGVARLKQRYRGAERLAHHAFNHVLDGDRHRRARPRRDHLGRGDERPVLRREPGHHGGVAHLVGLGRARVVEQITRRPQRAKLGMKHPKRHDRGRLEVRCRREIGTHCRAFDRRIGEPRRPSTAGTGPRDLIAPTRERW
jgi:hypothetical protein